MAANNEIVETRRWPAEWEPHDGCFILYPHNKDTYRLDKVRLEFAQVILAIANQGQEHVYVGCKTKEDIESCQEILSKVAATNGQKVDNVTCIVCPSNDTWARDTGPTIIIVKNSSSSSNTANDDNNKENRVGIDWNFNAYGGPTEGCYWPCDLDLKVAKTISNELSIPTESVDIIMEGGSIHCNGEGTLITTEECLLHTNRNPKMTKEQIESKLLKTLGATKCIWLSLGLNADDDTNGHVDNFCCFTSSNKVTLAWTDDEENDGDNYKRCRAAMKVLSESTTAKGESIEVYKLYLPSPKLAYTTSEAESLKGRGDGEIMAASYINYYIANSAVVVPQFGGDSIEADKAAIETLKPLFPNRTIVGVPSREILLGGGNIHCITQQLPKNLSQ